MKKGASGNRYLNRPEATDKLRLSAVRYLNARPVIHGLLQASSDTPFKLELDEPSELSRRLIEEETDAALAPVATLAHHGGLELVPGIAIGCDGAVQSVKIVSERPLEDIRSLVLDPASRSSVLLGRLILRQRKLSPELSLRSLDALDTLVKGGVAALVIGDRALETHGKFAFELDLGLAWKEWTGLPFVFAAWLARPGALSKNDVLRLEASLASGLASRTNIARAWAQEHGGDAAVYDAYLNTAIRYTLDEPAMAGLNEFLGRAADAGFLPETVIRTVGGERRGAQEKSEPSIDALLTRGAEGGRLSFHDAMRLANDAPLFDLGIAADARRKALHPDDVVTYIVDRNINYTNVCTTSCRFCAFYRPVGHKEGYVLSREVLAEKIRETVAAGGIQILLQGGLNPDLPLSWYEDLFRWMKFEFPIALHALSPEEIWHLSRLEEITIEGVLRRLRDAGMDSLPGGGAEVLTDRVRSQIARAKCTSEEWLECMRVVHRLGMKSTATMMFGTTDTWVDRIAHMLKIRDLQDETGGFTAFISWDYQYEQGVKQKSGETGAALYLRVQALSRLLLDNVPSIQSSWVTQGPAVGQVALRFGANDLGSVMFEENVVSSAGTTFEMDAAQMERHARAAGFRVAQRNMRYERLTDPA